MINFKSSPLRWTTPANHTQLTRVSRYTYWAYPAGEIGEAGAGGLKQNRLSEGNAVEAELAERNVELEIDLGGGRHPIAEALEGLLQLVAQLAFRLLGCQIVTVVHVLVLAQVSGDLANLGVKLNVSLLLLPEHHGILKRKK